MPTDGTVGIRMLGGSNGSSYTEIGYDFSNSTFYVDHTRCCAATSPIVQRAPLPAALLGGRLELVAFVDGGIVEAFLAGVAITALVSPDLAAGAPQVRSGLTDRSVSTSVALRRFHLGAWRCRAETRPPGNKTSPARSRTLAAPTGLSGGQGWR
eukprot:2563801-Prymnesium_polylepis.1